MKHLAIAAIVGTLLAAAAAPAASGSGQEPAAPRASTEPLSSPTAGAASEAPATASFTSPLYGYTVVLPEGWEVHEATMPADDPASTEDTATDAIRVPGTDTTIGILAWDLGNGTYEAWAKAYHDDVVAHVPSGCDGGDPASWGPIAIGDAQGHLLQKCNNAEAIIPIGRRVYVFSWGHETFDDSKHLPESAFGSFLLGVTLPDPSVAESPLWSGSAGPSATPAP